MWLLTILAALLIGATCGCSRVWNSTNRETLERDVAELIKRHGGGDVKPECKMVGTSRTGTCVLQVSSDVVARLASGLELREVISKDDYDELLDWEVANGCRSIESFDGSGAITVYRSERRSASLQLSNGSSFEYLLLYYRPDTGGLCVQVSYASG